ncbi:hypothetical protein GQ457_02G030790 [Hibiscus cannabinus]
MAFCAITWTVWTSRNEIIFKGKTWTEDTIFDSVLLRIGWWQRAKWPESCVSITDFISNPAAWSLSLGSKQVVNSLVWVPPLPGNLKFNADGAVQGSLGQAVIGGVLRDHDGKVIVKFSKSISHSDPATAELLAIKEALLIFSNLNLSNHQYLEVESDSSNVVCWIQKSLTTPVVFKELLSACIIAGSDFRWGINLIGRRQNGEADGLVKVGINRIEEFLSFGNNGSLEKFFNEANAHSLILRH